MIAKAGTVVTSHFLAIHAWSVCDTTSATFGLGKTKLMEMIQASKEVQQISHFME